MWQRNIDDYRHNIFSQLTPQAAPPGAQYRGRRSAAGDRHGAAPEPDPAVRRADPSGRSETLPALSLFPVTCLPVP